MCLCDGINAQELIDICNIKDFKFSTALLLQKLYDNCCYGILTTTTDPIVSPSVATGEAFPDGIGQGVCGCPISWILDSNNALYFSVDSGNSWQPIASFASCTINLPVFSDINTQDNESNVALQMARRMGCSLIFAYGTNGRIYVLDSNLNGGDQNNSGNWLEMCNFGSLPIISELYEYSGSQVETCAPTGSTHAKVRVWAAGGGCGFNGNIFSGHGGAGGYVEGEFDVVEDDCFTIIVGQGGINVNAGDSTVETFGFGGGSDDESSAGGLSGIFEGSPPILETDAAKAILVAGGGGSGASHTNGLSSCSFNGKLGGKDSENSYVLSDFNGSTVTCDNCGGSGGGYLGGSAASQKLCGGTGSYAAAGFGGKNFVDGTGSYPTTNTLNLFGVSFETANQDDPYYDTNSGNGCDALNTSNGNGNNGLVIVEWS